MERSQKNGASINSAFSLHYSDSDSETDEDQMLWEQAYRINGKIASPIVSPMISDDEKPKHDDSTDEDPSILKNSSTLNRSSSDSSPTKRKTENLLFEFNNTELNTSSELQDNKLSDSLDSEDEEILQKIKDSSSIEQFQVKRKGNQRNSIHIARQLEASICLSTNAR